jgi:hypothetical protein
MMDSFEVELTGRDAKKFDRCWGMKFDDKPGTWELGSGEAWTFRQWFK